MGNFINVPRSIFYDESLRDEKYSRREAFLDLVQMAAFNEKQIAVRNNIITVNRGQVATSIRFLSDRWGWSKDKVSRTLNAFEGASKVRQQRDGLITLITILNYDIYQGVSDTHKDADKDSNKDANKDKIKESNKRNKVQESNNKPLEFPFESEAFASVWAILIKQPKWKNKTQNALQLSLNKLGKYEEAFAIKLINDAIERGWQGVVFDDTPTAYQKWKDSQQSTQAQPMSARDIEWERTKRDGMKEEEEARERSRQKLLHDIAAGIIKPSTNETDGSLNL